MKGNINTTRGGLGKPLPDVIFCVGKSQQPFVSVDHHIPRKVLLVTSFHTYIAFKQSVPALALYTKNGFVLF